MAADRNDATEKANDKQSSGSDIANAESQAKKPRIDGVSHAPTPALISVPYDDDVDADVVKVMGIVCREVHHGLPLILLQTGITNAEIPLHEHMPLDIKAVVEKGDLSSYKEPWRKSRAVQAAATVHMYGAGGNPFWFRQSTTDVGDEFPRENVPWPLLCSYQDTLFAAPAKVDRILFPQSLLGYMKDPKLIDADFFPGNIVLVCGAPTLWARYPS